MTDGRSVAAMGSVASGVLNSGPYQPASYSMYSTPRATAKSTPWSPAAVLRASQPEEFRRVVVAHRPQPLLPEAQPLQ